jgi:hypothetical protein
MQTNDTTVQAAPCRKPEPNNIASTLITGAVWAVLGGVAGNIIGRFGDTKASGIGTRVGTLVGSITAAAIAISTTFNRQDHDISTDYYSALPVGAKPLPVCAANQSSLEGKVAEPSQEISKPA